MLFYDPMKSKPECADIGQSRRSRDWISAHDDSNVFCPESIMGLSDPNNSDLTYVDVVSRLSRIQDLSVSRLELVPFNDNHGVL